MISSAPPRRATLLAACAALVVPALTACTAGSSSADPAAAPRSAPGSPVSATPGGKQLKVVATTTQVGDFVRNVAGADVHLTQLLKPNIDPHDYEASPADVQAIADADVVVINGVGLEEGWLTPAVESSGFDGTTIDASKGVVVRAGNGTDEEEAGDPHIWHSPANAKVMVADIARGLGAADPADAAAFTRNAKAYSAKLDDLDASIRAQIGSLAADDRKLVTNHDAFGYYIQRYGLTFVGTILPGFDTQQQLSGKQLNDLVAKIRATGTKAIFSESSLPPNAARAIAAEAGVKVEAGDDALYGDTLGPVGSAGGTYLAMEKHNTRTIVEALK